MPLPPQNKDDLKDDRIAGESSPPPLLPQENVRRLAYSTRKCWRMVVINVVTMVMTVLT